MDIQPNVSLTDEDFENINPGDARTWIAAAGVYPAIWKDRTSSASPWGPKIKFEWLVYVTQDFSRSVTLHAFYNAKRDRGNRFKFGPNHAFRKDWIAANRGVLPSRPTALPLSVFKDKKFYVEVVTVIRDTRGPLHPSCYWSKVGRIIRPVGEDETVQGLPLQLSDITWTPPSTLGREGGRGKGRRKSEEKSVSTGKSKGSGRRKSASIRQCSESGIERVAPPPVAWRPYGTDKKEALFVRNGGWKQVISDPMNPFRYDGSQRGYA
jgi:hypothetical protein